MTTTATAQLNTDGTWKSLFTGSTWGTVQGPSFGFEVIATSGSAPAITDVGLRADSSGVFSFSSLSASDTVYARPTTPGADVDVVVCRS